MATLTLTKSTHPQLTAHPLPDTPFYERMRIGHLLRTGHPLVAHKEGREGYWQDLVRTCCAPIEGGR